MNLRILGIDPGYAIVGFGVLDYDGRDFSVVNFGAITTPAGMDFEDRLEIIYRDMNEVINTYHPEAMSLEKLFFQHEPHNCNRRRPGKGSNTFERKAKRRYGV